MLPMASRDISSLYVLNIYFIVYPVNPRRVRGAPKLLGGVWHISLNTDGIGVNWCSLWMLWYNTLSPGMHNIVLLTYRLSHGSMIEQYKKSAFTNMAIDTNLRTYWPVKLFTNRYF